MHACESIVLPHGLAAFMVARPMDRSVVAQGSIPAAVAITLRVIPSSFGGLAAGDTGSRLGEMSRRPNPDELHDLLRKHQAFWQCREVEKPFVGHFPVPIP